MSSEIILEIKDLNFKYKKSNFALENISFKMKNAAILGLIGENGSGKTTLLKVIEGFLVQEKGEIILEGKNIENDIIQIRDVSYIFQKAFLYPHLTIYQNLLMGLNGFGLNEDDKDQRVKKMLSKIKMLPYANVKPAHISEGQKQLVSVAKAIIREPVLLLMDEPFSNLDAISKSKCVELVKNINSDIKTSIIFVSHSFEDVSNICSDIIVLDNGKIIFDGPTLDCILSEDPRIQNLTRRMEKENKYES